MAEERAALTRRARRARRAWVVASLALYVALALASTWPLARRAGDALPCGNERSATVPLASAWALAWNADRLEHGYADYWQAPIFAPAPDSFALSEPAPLPGLLGAALLAASGSLVWSYGALVLLALVSNGVAARWLLRRLGVGQAAALAGGAMVVLLPFVHAELGVLPLIPLAPMLATIGALHAIACRATWRRGAALGVAFAATWLTCAQYALILALALFGPALYLAIARTCESRAAGLALARATAVALLVAGALLAPMLVGQVRARGEYDLTRGDETVRGLSAELHHYARAPWPELLPTPGVTTPGRGRRALYPGTIKLGLALALGGAALVARWRRRWENPDGDLAAPARGPHLRIAALAIGGVALAIGMGPVLAVGPFSLHGALAALVPGFDEIRSLYRAAVLVQLAIVFLAASALDAGWERSRRLPRPRVRRAGAIALAGLAALATVELWPRPPWFYPVPTEAHDAGWTGWLVRNTGRDAIIAHLPFAASSRSEDFEPTARWMYLQARHHRAMANGYASYFPPAHTALWPRVQGFPDDDSLDALRAAGVGYVVVERDRYAPEALGAQPRLVRVFADPVAKLDVYRVD